MKNTVLHLGWCILLFGFFGNLQAQSKHHRKDHHKKVKAYRISFLTRKTSKTSCGQSDSLLENKSSLFSNSSQYLV